MKFLLLLVIACFLISIIDALSAYDTIVLQDRPVGYWLLQNDFTSDASNHNLAGHYYGAHTFAKLPNGETANLFNGIDGYFEIPDDEHLEVTRTGILTIEAWMSPFVVNFLHCENDYVHWMGKGESGKQLWTARMYNKNSSRPQRISGYCFNMEGGLGSGSYFEDIIPIGTWIHYTLVINTKDKSSAYPLGYVKIYRDGKLRDMDSLQDYNIVPGDGDAPMRIGTRDKNSFFQGAIGKVAVYDYELTEAQVLGHNKNMRGI